MYQEFSPVLSQLTLRYCYYPHITGKESEATRGEVACTVTQLCVVLSTGDSEIETSS